MSKIAYFNLWLSVTWSDVRDWCLRWVYAQHNARVIIDFENRMSRVVDAATNGLMSKPYYDADVMEVEIRAAQSAVYDMAYAEGRADLAAELGVEDPSPVVPE